MAVRKDTGWTGAGTRHTGKIVFLAAFTGAAFAQAPDIEQIMSRVGRNQAKAQDLRKDFTYHQKQLLRMNYSNHKLAREERREYDVTPDVRGVKKELTKFEGHYGYKGNTVPYDRPEYHYKGLDIDADLINSMSEDMTNDKNSRDGIDHDLFPLTYHQQLKYDFKLIGSETYRGRQVYRVSFAPKKGKGIEDADWKGEALIDQAEYQPVFVSTRLAFQMPLLVKTLLGTDIKGLGFSVAYQKFEDGVWFPVSYGGEFEVRAVFFYKRTISVSMVNSDFKRSLVNSTVTYQTQQ
jgi:hypothetical protein